MATYITQATLRERLLAKGVKLSRQTLSTYRKQGVFEGGRRIEYGKSTYPLYEETDVEKLYKIIVRRYKSKKTKHKGVFISELPVRE